MPPKNVATTTPARIVATPSPIGMCPIFAMQPACYFHSRAVTLVWDGGATFPKGGTSAPFFQQDGPSCCLEKPHSLLLFRYRGGRCILFPFYRCGHVPPRGVEDVPPYRSIAPLTPEKRPLVPRGKGPLLPARKAAAISPRVWAIFALWRWAIRSFFLKFSLGYPIYAKFTV